MLFQRAISGVGLTTLVLYGCACASEADDPTTADTTSADTATSGSAGLIASAGATASAGRSSLAGMTAGPTAPGLPTSPTAPAGTAGAGPSAGTSASASAGQGPSAAGQSASAGAGVAGQASVPVAGSAGGSAGALAAGSAAAAGGSPAGCDMACPAPPAGVTIGCQTRFMFGVNYAWINFGQDFGGGASGVAANAAAVRAALQDMKANGVNVVRWWMHPSFFVPSVTFDASGTPTGMGGSEVSDIQTALALAAETSVYLKLTLFSFDNFRGDDRAGHGLTPIVSDATRRKALIDHVVRPIARAVSESPHAERMISWDVINEPEWAMMGQDGHGDEPFDPNPELMSVPFQVMETFVSDVVQALRSENKAPITVGQAAIKWARAFTQVGLDYYDMHYYGWVDQYFPIGGKSLAEYGIADKPVVVGEFPLDGWTNPNGTLDATQIAEKLWSAGFAGAKGWAFTKDGNWAGNKAKLLAFANAKGCSVAY